MPKKRRGRRPCDDTRALAHMALLFVSGKTKSLRELADLSKHLAAEGASPEATIDRLRRKYKQERKKLEPMARDARLSPAMADFQRLADVNTEELKKSIEAERKAAAASFDRLAESLLGKSFRTPTVEESLEAMYKKLKKGKD